LGRVAEGLWSGPEGLWPGPEGLRPGSEGLRPGSEGLWTGSEGLWTGSEGLWTGPEGLRTVCVFPSVVAWIRQGVVRTGLRSRAKRRLRRSKGLWPGSKGVWSRAERRMRRSEGLWSSGSKGLRFVEAFLPPAAAGLGQDGLRNGDLLWWRRTKSVGPRQGVGPEGHAEITPLGGFVCRPWIRTLLFAGSVCNENPRTLVRGFFCCFACKAGTIPHPGCRQLRLTRKPARRAPSLEFSRKAIAWQRLPSHSPVS